MFKVNYNYITVNQKSVFYLLKTLENNVHNNSTEQVHHHMPHIHLKAWLWKPICILEKKKKKNVNYEKV